LQAAASDESYLARQLAQDELLDGVLVGGENHISLFKDSDGKSVPLAAPVSDTPPLRVFFVNGIRNTSKDARASELALQQWLGPEVELIYNHSYLEIESDYVEEFCGRELALDNPDGSENASDWLAEAASGAASANEYLRGNCRRLAASIDVGTRIQIIMDIIRGGTELIYQRVGQTDAANSSVNSRLVTSIQFSLDAGYGVVVIGHSQGTMFVQNALKQVDEWWTEKVRKGDGCGPPPVAAIYVAPAIPVAGRGNERYVLLNGDRIQMIGLKDPTANPTPAQELMSLHSLNTYLMPGTPSQLQILEHYATLKKEVLERAEFGLSKVKVIVNEQKKELKGYEGDTVKYGVRLACKPDLEVAIWLESAGKVTFAESQLLFDPRIPRIDWDVEQTVEVTINEGAYAPDEDDIVPISLVTVGHNSESHDPTFQDVDIREMFIEVLSKEPTPTPEPRDQATPLILGQYNAVHKGVPAWDNSATLLVSPCYTTVDGRAANVVEICWTSATLGQISNREIRLI
jgi:hypothetical protein